MYEKSITELSQALTAKTVSSVELTQLFLDRIKKFNIQLNCFISVNEETALTAAKAADDAHAKGQTTALTGIPLAHKDIFCTDGSKTTCGSKMLENFISPYNATVVKKLSQAGTVLLGKTNMDEFAMGSSNENSFFGAVKNPWVLDSVPGGSSGGSAAAVAARLVPAATGTDTGGSIRQPAAYCGITGLKPTYGLVSRYGMIAFASSLDQGGPMAYSAQDCALLLNHMAGYDEKDSTSVAMDMPDYTSELNAPIKDLRIGVPKQFFTEGLDDNIAKVINEAIKTYEQQGAKIIEIDLPNCDLSLAAYYIIAPAEASSNLARYDGVRYGHRCENPKNLEDLYKRTRQEGFGAEVKRRIMIGTYALSSGYYDAYYLKALKIRRLIAQDFFNALQQVDVLMGPVSPMLPFKIGEKCSDPTSLYLTDIYTIGVNLAGLPAISIPAGFVDNKPVGLHIIANRFREAKLLNVAHQYQQQTDWHKQIPKLFDSN